MLYFTINAKKLIQLCVYAILLILLCLLFCLWALGKGDSDKLCTSVSDASYSDIENSPEGLSAPSSVELSSAGASAPYIPDDAVVPAYVNLSSFSFEQTLTRPLENAYISSSFGFRVHPINGAYSFHSGLDLAAAEGTEISAVLDGVVTAAKYADDYGNYIIIDHGDFQTLYAHCLSLCVSAGDNVLSGQKIAEVGSTGNATGSHLHIEIRRGGQRYNPDEAIGGFYS